jgi:hypothetical protein
MCVWKNNFLEKRKVKIFCIIIIKDVLQVKNLNGLNFKK